MGQLGAVGLFSLLGASGFAMAAALGILGFRGTQIAALSQVLPGLALPAALAAVPILLAGLTARQRLRARPDLEGFRAAGTWVTLVAAGLQVATLAVAWPRVEWLLPIGVLNAATLAAAAILFRLPILHAGAIACAAIVYLSGYHLLAGHLAAVPDEELAATLLRCAVSSSSGTALLGLCALAGTAGACWPAAAGRTTPWCTRPAPASWPW